VRYGKASKGQGAVTGGAASGTSGGKAVTNGWRIEWAPVAFIAAVGVVVAVINATSAIMEGQTGGPSIDSRAAWLYEVSSVVMVVLLSPAIGWMVWRVPPPTEPSTPAWLGMAGVHFAAACAFSVLHIAGMVALRKLGYASAGSTYVFAYNGDLVVPFIYEWRKDLLTYASNALCFWAWSFWQAQRAAQALVAEPASPVADQRIEVRDGARVSLIDPAAIGWVEAAGNYVEIHARDATHLVRGTLSGFEERLAEHGFVRIHRSRLINKARVSGFRPTPSGDLEITLDDGRIVGGSRRFRSLLEG
jgi:DNA-binding LytR/AlgR family response regulator